MPPVVRPAPIFAPPAKARGAFCFSQRFCVGRRMLWRLTSVDWNGVCLFAQRKNTPLVSVLGEINRIPQEAQMITTGTIEVAETFDYTYKIITSVGGQSALTSEIRKLITAPQCESDSKYWGLEMSAPASVPEALVNHIKNEFSEPGRVAVVLTNTSGFPDDKHPDPPWTSVYILRPQGLGGYKKRLIGCSSPGYYGVGHLGNHIAVDCFDRDALDIINPFSKTQITMGAGRTPPKVVAKPADPPRRWKSAVPSRPRLFSNQGEQFGVRSA